MSYINIWFKYFSGNLSKKLLFFALVITFLRTNIDINLFLSFFFFYLSYMSIYFLNDYLDREKDKKETILKYKLSFSKKQLLILTFIHFLFAFYFLNNIFLFIIFLLILLTNTTRSFVNLYLRTVLLYILELFNFLFLFYMVSKKFLLFLDFFPIFSLISIIYSYGYLLYKRGKLSKYEYFTIWVLILVNLWISLPLLYKYTYYLSIVTLIYLCFMFPYFINSKSPRSINALNKSGVALYLISFLLIFISIWNNLPILDTKHFKIIKSIELMNQTIKNNIIRNINYSFEFIGKNL